MIEPRKSTIGDALDCGEGGGGSLSGVKRVLNDQYPIAEKRAGMKKKGSTEADHND